MIVHVNEIKRGAFHCAKCGAALTGTLRIHEHEKAVTCVGACENTSKALLKQSYDGRINAFVAQVKQARIDAALVASIGAEVAEAIGVAADTVKAHAIRAFFILRRVKMGHGKATFSMIEKVFILYRSTSCNF